MIKFVVPRRFLSVFLHMPMLAVLFCLLILTGCGGHSANELPADNFRQETRENLSLLGHTIQVGAFSKVENAVRLMILLESRGLDAYYFRHESGLYKVRFGDFYSYQSAEDRALSLRQSGVISEFYIVRPSDYAVSDRRHYSDDMLREHLVKTARRFIGVPYKWGGESVDDGFDCSGLTMTVYKMNGLNMPRNSRAQFRYGQPVDAEDLRPGDLVFFATNGGRRVTHVGIYIGRGRFIHAPQEGKNIRTASLSSAYFRGRYIGGRSYLPADSGKDNGNS